MTKPYKIKPKKASTTTTMGSLTLWRLIPLFPPVVALWLPVGWAPGDVGDEPATGWVLDCPLEALPAGSVGEPVRVVPLSKMIGIGITDVDSTKDVDTVLLSKVTAMVSVHVAWEPWIVHSAVVCASTVTVLLSDCTTVEMSPLTVTSLGPLITVTAETRWAVQADE